MNLAVEANHAPDFLHKSDYRTLLRFSDVSDKVLVMRLTTLTVAFLAMLIAAPQVSGQLSASKSRPHADIHGNIVHLLPSNSTFAIPVDWVRWNKSNSKSLHLSRQEIKRVENLQGEWDRPFSAIVNSIFPIERCGAHVGGMGNVQMRVYIGAWNIEQVEATIKKSGTAMASKFSKKVSLTVGRFGQWRTSNLSYDLDYGDYFGTARIDVYARTFGKQTVALVFSSTNNFDKDRQDIIRIVSSFKAK